MKKIKLLFFTVLALLMCLMICSCGDDTDSSGSGTLDFSGVVFEDAQYTYDGQPKMLSVKGQPVTATVQYSENRVQTNAGVYTVTATVSMNGYNTKTLTATMTINKAEYPVSFSDKTVTYDGGEHQLELEGELPDGISVEYTGNGQINAGEYQVIASFSGTGSENYVPSMTATLKIEKASYDMSTVSFIDKYVKYDGTPHSIEAIGVPDGVTVSYEGGGTEIGQYDVSAKFEIADTDNYNRIPSMDAVLTVLDPSANTFTVRLLINDLSGVASVSSTELMIPKGESAKFKVVPTSTYLIGSLSAGAYDEQSYMLTLPDVQSDMTVSISLAKLNYDRNDTVYATLQLGEYDSASVSSGSHINLGTMLTLSAGNTSRNFLGWSVGGTLVGGGKLIGTERIFTFRVVPDIIGSGRAVSICANYRDINSYTYDPNGGEVNTASTNMLGNSYYTAKYEDGVVNVTVSDAYMSFAESVSLFWDDATFTREGYVLIEYNTKPDGTGEPYSLGSKFFAASNPNQKLYCIWKEASLASDFEYEDVTWNYASDVTELTAPHWKINGIKITKYNGNDKCVVIPEMIEGKYVTTIDPGAFSDKDMEVLILNKYILRIEDGAFTNCPKLTTVYMNDSIYYMNDEAFDEATYTNFKNFYLNACMAPRFSANTHGDGTVFSVKFSRLLASQDKNRVIVVSGSSTYQGLSSAYLEGLLDGEYTVVNLGTTRTGTGMIFFEALQHYTHEGDIVVYAPENHVNMFGQNEMWYRSFYDTEGMYNVFRYIDISHYPSVFSALSSYNRDRRYTSTPRAYEDIAKANRSDKYGDFQQEARDSYRDDCTVDYIDSYFITLNQYYKNDLDWANELYQIANKDYLTSSTWTDFTIYKDEVNRAIALIRATGAKVYFGFAPANADDIVPEAQNREWMEAYDKLISDNYDFDGLLGSSADYVFNHQYFFDCAYHVNDYGRTYRTYQMYLDLCEILGIEDAKSVTGAGTDYDGCNFEFDESGNPIYKLYTVSYLQ